MILAPRQQATLVALAKTRVEHRAAGDVAGHEFHGNQFTEGAPTQRPDGAPVQSAPRQGSIAERRGVKVGMKVTYAATSGGLHGSDQGTMLRGSGVVRGFVSNRGANLPGRAVGGGKAGQDVLIHDAKRGSWMFIDDSNVRVPMRHASNPLGINQYTAGGGAGKASRIANDQSRQAAKSGLRLDHILAAVAHGAAAEMHGPSDVGKEHARRAEWHRGQGRLRTAGDYEGHPFRGNQWTNIGNELVAQASSLNVEHGALFDASGKELGRSSGDEGSVDYPEGFKRNDEAMQASWHHTHPVEASLSLGDMVSFANTTSLKEIYAHTPTTTYKAERVPGKDRELYFAAKDVFGEHAVKAIDAYLKHGDVERLRKETLASQHTVMQTLHDRGLVKYSSMKRNLKTAGDVEGHEFHGNQYVTSYHGTTEDAAVAIRKEGLRGDKAGTHSAISASGTVSTSSSASHAWQYARDRAEATGKKPVVVEVRVPASQKHFSAKGFGGHTIHTYKKIHSKHIVAVHREEIRSASHHPESPVHKAADANLRSMTLAVWYAFLTARKATTVDAAMTALKVAIKKAVTPVLLKTVVAGGNAGLGMLRLRTAAFNQDQERDDFGRWTSGGASGTLYHGTQTKGLGDLKPNKNGVVFLTPDKHAAEFHTVVGVVDGQHSKDGELHHVEVKINNPVVISSYEYDSSTSDRKWLQEQQEAGHDAIVADDGRSVALFRTVKSVKVEKASGPHNWLRSAGDVAGHEFHGNQWTTGAGVTDGDVADASIAWASQQYPRADLIEKKATGLQPREKFYKGEVSGLRVSTDIPNTDSISATFNDSNEYDELPGIREVALADLTDQDYAAADDNQRVKDLADRIKESGEIKPLIVVIDGTRKPYVLEGGHRVLALQKLGKRTAPALVIVDHTAQKMRSAGDFVGHEFHGNQWTSGTDGDLPRVEHPDTSTLEGLNGYGFFSREADKWTHGVDVEARQNAFDYAQRDDPEIGQALREAYFGKPDDELPEEVNVYRVGSLSSGLASFFPRREQAVAYQKRMGVDSIARVTFDPRDLVPSGSGSGEVWGSPDDALGHRALALRTLKPPIKRKGPFRMRFDAENESAVLWAEEHAALLADGIAATTRTLIQDAVATAHRIGSVRSVYETIRDVLGDKDRAQLIARTETMTAANEGQRQGWAQAVEEGLLPETATVSWIATDVGACPECEALDGTTRTLDGEYDDPDAADGPPLHPNCRCTEGISAY